MIDQAVDAILFAGPNGAGKTTFARQYLPLEHADAAYLNADEIQQSADEYNNIIGAGRELLRRLARLEAARRSFALETTLSSRMYARRIPKWNASGYCVCLHFIELPSADFAVRRVAERVAAGGHDVPEPDIRRRFTRGLDLFHQVYKPLVLQWYHWYSDHEGIRLVDQQTN